MSKRGWALKSARDYRPLHDWLLCAVALVSGWSGAAAVANGQQPKEEAGVSIVEVPVFVRDEAGKPVLDLKQEDFTVYEDGQQIRDFVYVGDVARAGFRAVGMDRRHGKRRDDDHHREAERHEAPSAWANVRVPAPRKGPKCFGHGDEVVRGSIRRSKLGPLGGAARVDWRRWAARELLRAWLRASTPARTLGRGGRDQGSRSGTGGSRSPDATPRLSGASLAHLFT